jgi:hypothetical protein
MRDAARILVLAGAALLSALGHGGEATPSVAEASAVKAAFLYNFAKFVHWPDEAFGDAVAPFTFCLFGADPLGDALSSLEGKRVNGRPVVVRRLRHGARLGACQVLFVSPSERLYARRLIAATRGEPVLSVSDIPGFAASGGIIGLVRAEGKLRFEINTAAARGAGLIVSSQLLKLASALIQTGEVP